MTAAMFEATIHGLRPPYRRGLGLCSRIEQWSMPVTECGCWIWLGAMSAGRYGSLRYGGASLKAHRASWMAHRGEIPTGLHVLHSCDTPLCVNPDHLFLGTHQDNMDDKERKGRGNQPRGLRNGAHTKPWSRQRGDQHYTRRVPGVRAGTNNGRAKLTPEIVSEIRASELGCHRAAKHFGVSKRTILKIRHRKLWGHVP